MSKGTKEGSLTLRDIELRNMCGMIKDRFSGARWYTNNIARGNKVNPYQVMRKVAKEYTLMDPIYFLAIMEYLDSRGQPPSFRNMVGIIKSENFNGAVDRIEMIVKHIRQDMMDTAIGRLMNDDE